MHHPRGRHWKDSREYDTSCGPLNAAVKMLVSMPKTADPGRDVSRFEHWKCDDAVFCDRSDWCAG